MGFIVESKAEQCSTGHALVYSTAFAFRIKLCPSGAHTCARPFFRCCDLDIKPMTLKLEGDVARCSENVPSHQKWSCYVKAFETPNGWWNMYGKWKKYENIPQGQRSNVPTFNHFTVGHIPTKLHQFLISIFRDFVRTSDRHTDTQTDTHTDAAKFVLPYLPPRSISGAQVNIDQRSLLLRWCGHCCGGISGLSTSRGRGDSSLTIGWLAVWRQVLLLLGLSAGSHVWRGDMPGVPGIMTTDKPTGI